MKFTPSSCTLSLVLLTACGNQGGGDGEHARYVGREVCRPCHAAEYEAFAGSDHDLAMDVATEETVLGDFGGTSFTHLGVTSTFSRRNGRFFATTEGPEGVPGDFEVRYTFGATPLQQYLVEFPGGRLQSLPLCWDTRPREEGGQRWFHIHDRDQISPDDVLFWTHVSQNWNTMCAECHSTNLRKNFDPTTRTYSTTWSEIDVSCEACHGPASAHVEWAERRSGADHANGLTVKLKDSPGFEWKFTDSTFTAVPGGSREGRKQIDVCARCHSRRETITAEYEPGRSFPDTHHPVLLEEPLYYPDGQIRDEVYEYGSFLQSRMYQKGVVCSDCHDPHSTRPRAEGDALCFQCHAAPRFGSREHHFHEPGSDGARCIACHMTERTYMVVDPRRDHSFRVPRPDLTLRIGVPNACNGCHPDRSPAWAAERISTWYGPPDGRGHYGEVFFAARQGTPGADRELMRLASDSTAPAIVRATAISMLRDIPGTKSAGVLREQVRSGEPLIRFAAAFSSGSLPEGLRLPLLAPLLEDSIRLVRVTAARSMAAILNKGRNGAASRIAEGAWKEYEESQRLNADRPSANMNLGNLYLDLGEYEKAEEAYREALRIDPSFVEASVNLADLYRATDRDRDGETVLMNALRLSPDHPALHHAIGLLFVRLNDRERALAHFETAYANAPDNPVYCSVYGIALHDKARSDEAIAILASLLRRRPGNEDLLLALTTIHRNRGEATDALRCVRELREFHPDEKTYRDLEARLRSEAR
jgi:predicted CXXCH cytochrome family protein